MSGPTGNPLVMYIDLVRCIGCDACSLACKQENNVGSGELWNRVYGAENGTTTVRVLPMQCQQCEQAPCMDKCTRLGYNAIWRRPDGIVMIDAAKCVGCKLCIPECRYNAMTFNTTLNKAEKCHFCWERVDQGLQPACVQTCLGLTREFGRYADLIAKHPNAKTMGRNSVHVLYDNMGSRPSAGRGDRPTAGYPDPRPFH